MTILFNFATTVDFECYQDDNGDCESARDLAALRVSVVPTLDEAFTIARNELIDSMGTDDAEVQFGEWERDEPNGQGDHVYTISDQAGIIVCYLTVREI